MRVDVSRLCRAINAANCSEAEVAARLREACRARYGRNAAAIADAVLRMVDSYVERFSTTRRNVVMDFASGRAFLEWFPAKIGEAVPCRRRESAGADAETEYGVSFGLPAGAAH